MIENYVLLLIGLFALCLFFVIGDITANLFDWN